MKMELLATSTVADDALRFVASSPNNNEPTIRTKVTANYEREIEKENVNENIRLINLVNAPFEEQRPEVENNITITITTNRLLKSFLCLPQTKVG
jgi:hypothetical protein